MREVYHDVYEVQKQKKLPVKWMAPESLYEQIFTSKSDVLVTFHFFRNRCSIQPEFKKIEGLTKNYHFPCGNNFLKSTFK